MDRLISCEFNMDNTCVELKFFDSDFLCIGAEESGTGTFGRCSERINTGQM